MNKFLKFDGTVSVTWLFTAVVALIVNCVTMWNGFIRVEQAVERQAAESREQRKITDANALKINEHEWRLVDYDRRIVILEKNK